MKLTKEQLTKIIKEELKSILDENANMPKDRIRRDIEGDGEELPKGEDGEIDSNLLHTQPYGEILLGLYTSLILLLIPGIIPTKSLIFPIFLIFWS